MTLPPSAGVLTLAETAHQLVSWWKPLLLFAPFVAWAWLISTLFDKHAARFFLGREKWNAIHMTAGMLALIAGFLMPVPGIGGVLLGFTSVVLILGIDIALFAAITNKDERVPESQHIRLDFSKISEAREVKAASKQQATVQLEIKNASGIAVQAPNKDTPDYAIRANAEHIFIKASQVRASQVDFAPATEATYAASYLIDGVRQAGDAIPTADAITLIDFWKSCAELDIKDRRRKISGMIKVTGGAGETGVKIVTSGSKSGMRLTLVFDPDKAVRRPIEKLGFLDQQLEDVKALGQIEGGVVLLAAPSDHGRTTTAYSMLNLHDAYTQNVQTVETESEDMLEGVRQIVYEAKDDGPDFASTVRSVLRRDPDVVSVMELPDVDTAKEIAKADLSRSRVYVSIKGDGALASAQLWVKAVGDAKLAGEGLKGLIAQRLLRKLCDNCRVPYQPPPEILQKLGLPPDKVKQLHKKGGQVLIRNKPEVCPVCQGLGYVGQIGVFEVYVLDDEMRSLIAGQDWIALRNALRKTQRPSIQQAALRRAVEGVTSIEEVMRVTASAPSKQKSKKKSGAAGEAPVKAG